jgi:hypothetical protein
MAKSINDTQKKRGRPATGVTPMTGVRFSDQAMQAIRRWAKHQPDNPTRAEAIRRLVEIALAGEDPTKQTSPEDTAKAADMAAQRIDKLVNPALPEAEQRTRKRRLIKGPQEFRDMRGDQPKPKR